MKLGFSTKCLKGGRWYEDALEFGFEAIEIARRATPVHFIPHYVEKLKDHFANVDLSMHSATTWLFSGVPQFEHSEIELLKGEVLMSQMLGVKELIFHLKHEKLRSAEKSRIGAVIAEGKEMGVDLVYESNSRLDSSVVFDFLDSFPDVGYNLDLGHLNGGIFHKNIGMEMDDFLEKVKDRIVYVHAHNNDGTYDQHLNLGAGTLDWKHVLDIVKKGKNLRKVIIESNKLDEMLASKELLEGYFSQ